MASSPDAATQTMINNLPEKTGKSLDEWLALLKKQSFQKHGEEDDLVSAQYSNAKDVNAELKSWLKKAYDAA